LGGGVQSSAPRGKSIFGDKCENDLSADKENREKKGMRTKENTKHPGR